MDLLFHEVPVIALLHQGGSSGDDAHRPLDRIPRHVEDARAAMVDGHIVALAQIGDAVGKGPDRQGVRTDEHLPIAIADHQGAAPARAHDQLILALDQHAEGIGALQPIQGRLEGGQGG